MLYPILIVLFFCVMFLYFRLANHYNIIDRPNERSSHKEIIVRGGGIIFIAAALFTVILVPKFNLLFLSLFTIGVISFLDDKLTLSSKIRLPFQLISVTILIYYLDLYKILTWWEIVFLYILVIGIINAYNFMDGINGITGIYTIVVLSSLLYINLKNQFTNELIITIPITACVVFLFFNFRKKAKCFAGDVGSITIGFWIVILLLMAIKKTGNVSYILFLSVYGIDTVFTIVRRLIAKQNIFQAHRMHLYQYLVNERQMPHLRVAIIYGIIQMIINIFILSTHFNFIVTSLIILLPAALIYIIIRLLIDALQNSIR